MGKVTKKAWLILIIVALALPMFVGCEPEPEVDLVAEAKSSFFTYLKSEVNAKDVATVTVTGNNIAVAFKSAATSQQIKVAADALLVTLKAKAQDGSNFKLAGKTYAAATAKVADIRADLFTAMGSNAGTVAYEANVKHDGQNFTISGDITFSGK